MNFSREDTKAIKGAAVMLMLYHHLFAFPERIAEDITYFPAFMIMGNTSAYLVGMFGKLCVALFVFLGGYGTYLSCAKSSNLTRTLSKKITGLYSAYWKVFFIFIPICMFLQVPRVTVKLNDFLWNLSGLKITYCGEWWFFTPYVALLFLYPLFHRLFNAKRDIFSDLLLVLVANMVVLYVLPQIDTYAWAADLNRSRFWNIICSALDLAPSFFIGCVFAKHDLLSKVKQRFSGKLYYCIGSLIFLALIFYFRATNGGNFDYLLAPAFTMALTVFLHNMPVKFFKVVFEKIGNESTTIWLIHSIYCYMILQHLVYFPKFSVFIFLWLTVLCYVSAVILRKLSSFAASGIDAVRQHRL